MNGKPKWGESKFHQWVNTAFNYITSMIIVGYWQSINIIHHTYKVPVIQVIMRTSIYKYFKNRNQIGDII